MVLVEFYFEKIENLEDLLLFYLYFFEFTRFIYTPVSFSHKNESILTVLKKIDFSIDFYFFLCLLKSLENFILY